MKTRLQIGFLVIFMTLAVPEVHGQILNTGPSGGNKKAVVGEQIGITKILINYDRPGVKGREGKIWGTGIAHYGFVDLGFGPSKAAPWRAGSNESTTITFSEDVIIEGKPLAAGTYGLFMGLSENETIVIFSKNSTSWGSFYYDQNEDALRVTVQNVTLPESVEWLKYEFINQTPNSTTIALMWEKRMIPFKVESDLVKTHIASFKRELRSSTGFIYQSYVQAAQFCLANNVELDLALEWTEQAVSGPFVGEKNFTTLSLKATVLKALNRQEESDAAMKEALPFGNALQVHQYARSLQAQERYKEAFEVFKFNYDQHPKEFTTIVGLARGYSSLGEFKKALKYMKEAQPLASDDLNKKSVQSMIKKLESGKDANK